MSPLKLIAFVGACLAVSAADSPSSGHLLQTSRSAPSDLEITGAAVKHTHDAIRYISYEHLLTLPQVTVTVTGDDNFRELPHERITVTGVYLDVLESSLGVDSNSDLVTAHCADGYRSDFTREYIQSHRPILALKIDGEPVKTWVAQTHTSNPGRYFITHEAFRPSFSVLSYQEIPKIPAMVVRLDFGSSQPVFHAIAPHGDAATNPLVTVGFRIAQQDCYRCHNMGSYGGTKANRSWQTLGTYAATSPSAFERYIRNPKSVDPKSAMPANPEFDKPTVEALQAYFQTFAPGVH
jgi:mono/diheme cytochrome c family protein